MATNSRQVERYFDLQAGQWDSLYDENRLTHALNQKLRRGMYDRVIKTFEALGDLHSKRVLDVGCGSGRISALLAQRGATVVGIDFAENMIQLAEEHVRAKGVDSRVTFIRGDFVEYRPAETFDSAIALGVFDYVQHPVPFLQSMGKVARQVIASFPGHSPIREPLRKLRYGLRGCPLYFYAPEDLPRIARDAGFHNVEVIPYASSGFLLVGTR